MIAWQLTLTVCLTLLENAQVLQTGPNPRKKNAMRTLNSY